MSKKNKKNEKPRTTQSSKVYNVKIVREKKSIFSRMLPLLISLGVSVGIFCFANYKSLHVNFDNFDSYINFFSEKVSQFIEITGFSFLIWLISIVYNENK